MHTSFESAKCSVCMQVFCSFLQRGRESLRRAHNGRIARTILLSTALAFVSFSGAVALLT